MKGFIGYWEDRLTFSPAVKDEDIFIDLKLSVRAEGRTLYLTPDKEFGIGSLNILRDRHAGLGLAFGWYTLPATFKDIGWARWMRHEIDMIMVDNSYRIEIAPDHLLPWPKFMNGVSNDMTEIAIREFRLRTIAAFRAGGDFELKTMLRAVPAKFKRLIMEQVWGDIITTARKENL